MPTSAHQVPLLVFCERPEILLELLADALGASAIRYDRVVDHSNDLSSLTPVEMQADLILVFYQGDEPMLVLLVEVQRVRKEEKLWVWPGYVGVPFVPLVLGPAEVPVVSTVEQARAAKEMALLSLAVHAGGPQGTEVVDAESNHGSRTSSGLAQLPASW